MGLSGLPIVVSGGQNYVSENLWCDEAVGGFSVNFVRELLTPAALMW